MRGNECKHYSYNPFQQREGEENFCKNIRSLTKFLFMIRGILSNREGGGGIFWEMILIEKTLNMEKEATSTEYL